MSNTLSRKSRPRKAIRLNPDGSWKKHKYVKRINTPSGFRYIYSETAKRSKNTYSVKNFLTKFENTFSSVPEKLGRAVRDVRDDAKIFIDNAEKLIDSFNDQVITNIDEQMKKLLDNGKKKVDEFLKSFEENETSLEKNVSFLEINEEETNFLSSNFNKLSKPETPEISMKQVNPNYSKGSLEYSFNCYSCAIAMDLRQRGYDVEAIADPDGEDFPELLSCYSYNTADYSPENHDDNISSEIFKNLNFEMSSGIYFGSNDIFALYDVGMLTDYKRVEESLYKKYGDSSGILDIVWKRFDTAHVQYWTCTNGVLSIYDGQTGEKIDGRKEFRRVDIAGFVRTDNLVANEDILNVVRRA